MPCDYTKYPPNWPQLRLTLLTRSRGRCECTGQCGLHGGTKNPRRCVERNHTPAIFAKGRIVLTCAHLCSCDPLCAEPAHIIAACQRCHLRIDRFLHARHRKQKNTSLQNYNTQNEQKAEQSHGPGPCSQRG